jgi:hypothetical protein
MNMEIGTEAEQFQEKEYINGVFVALQCICKTLHGGCGGDIDVEV